MERSVYQRIKDQLNPFDNATYSTAEPTISAPLRNMIAAVDEEKSNQVIGAVLIAVIVTAAVTRKK